VKVLCLYVALMSFAGTMLTASRGGILGLVAGLVVFIILSAVALTLGAGNRRFVALLALAGGLVATAGLGWYIYESSYLVQDRYSRLLDDSYRSYIFPVVSRQFQLNPLWGTGAGTFTYYARQFHEIWMPNDDIYAHNDWAQVASDFGFPALVLLLAVVLLHFANGFRGLIRVLRQRMTSYSRPQSHAAALLMGALSCLVVFVVHSFIDFNMQIPANALLASAFLGMLANAGVEGERQKSRGLNLIRRLPGLLVAVAGGGWLLVCVWQAALPEYYWLQAENAVLKGDWKLAASEAKKGVAKKFPCPGLHCSLGESYMLESLAVQDPRARWLLVRDAAKEFSRAVEMAPMDSGNRVLMVQASTRMGLYNKGEAEVLDSIRLNPDQSRSYLLYARILESRGRLQEALRLHQLFAARPTSRQEHQESLKEIEEIRKKIVAGANASGRSDPAK